MLLNQSKNIGFVNSIVSREETSNETARKKIVALVFTIYWLLIFEGAFRKWVFPEYHQIILFLRDPIVLMVYFVAIKNNLLKYNWLLISGLIISLAFLGLILIQQIVHKTNPLTFIYGWRMYCFYLPLCFVIKDNFEMCDIYKLIRQTLYISIPIAVLVYFQFISPPDSFINKAYGTGKIFRVTGNIVRTTGTFTFTAGQYMFVGCLMAMTFFCWLSKNRSLIIKMPFLVICTISSLSTLLLSGSRTAFFMTALIVIATLFALLITKDNKLKMKGILIVAFLILIGVYLFLGPLSDSFDALSNRFSEAEASEGSPFMRAIAPFILFWKYIATTPLIGHGVGLGTNGGTLLAFGKEQSYTLAEDEWSRIIQEAGPGIGLIYIFYRIFFTLHLAMLSIKSVQNDTNLLPLIFWGYIAYYIFIGQITLTSTIHGFNWIFVGLIMAAAKNEKILPKLVNNKVFERPFPNIVSISRVSG